MGAGFSVLNNGTIIDNNTKQIITKKQVVEKMFVLSANDKTKLVNYYNNLYVIYKRYDNKLT